MSVCNLKTSVGPMMRLMMSGMTDITREFAASQKAQGQQVEKKPEVAKGVRFRSIFKVQQQTYKVKSKGHPKGYKGKAKEPFPVDWMSKGTGKHKTKIPKTTKDNKGKRLYR